MPCRSVHCRYHEALKPFQQPWVQMFSARHDLVFFLACLLVFMLDGLACSQVSPWGLYLLPIFVSGWLFGTGPTLS